MGVQMLVSALLQVALFTVVPFVWWLLVEKRKTPFFLWLGLKKPDIQRSQTFFLLFLATLLFFAVLSQVLIPWLLPPDVQAVSQFSGMGLAALLPALIHSFIQTGLSEEILFRGFIGKRCIEKWGFAIGNTIQAALFGLLHGAMFFAAAGLVKALLIVALTGAIGWMMGYINEKEAGGSILPSVIMHGLSNLISSLVFMLG